MKPTRKRAYHRALKRGEPWAVTEKGVFDLVNYATKQFYNDLTKPNPLLELVGLSEWLPDYKRIPVVYDPFFGLDRTKEPFRFSEDYKPTRSLWERIKSWFHFNP